MAHLLGEVLVASTDRAVGTSKIAAATPAGIVMRRVIDRQSDHLGTLQAFVDLGHSERTPAALKIKRRTRHADNGENLGQTMGQTWRSGNGRLLHFTTSTLIACRAPARAVYVLVRRDGAGHAVALFVGAAISLAPTLNLARIRERAAILCANEVHLLDLAHMHGTYAARRLVRDLRAGLRQATA